MHTRRGFIIAGSAVAAATVIPGVNKTSADQFRSDRDRRLASDPVFQQLRHIFESPDGKEVHRLLTDFYTDPALVSVATQFLSSSSTTLSSFQKDIYNTFLTLTQDLSLLKRVFSQNHLSETDRAAARLLAETAINSPSSLTLQAAAAELKKLPNLADLVQLGVKQFSATFNSQLPPAPSTGVPQLDEVVRQFVGITQSPSYVRFSKAVLQVTERDDFSAFVVQLPPSAFAAFIPYQTVMSIRLPIDSPDKIGTAAIVGGILLALIILFPNEAVFVLEEAAAALVGLIAPLVPFLTFILAVLAVITLVTAVVLQLAQAAESTFDGSYSGAYTDSNGCIHSEADTIIGGRLNGQQTFCLNDPSLQGTFTITGVVTPISPHTATIAGEVTINNDGVRTAPLTASGISTDSTGRLVLTWSATDPIFGGIGGVTYKS